ncbi:MAG: signal peptidase I [Anaerolineales bacterium]|nr:signal peptidase I [Anaerolineales bacterium]
MALPPHSPHTTEDVGPLDRQNVVALETQPPSTGRRMLLELIETILLALFLFLAINFVSARIRVDGVSMEPTFQLGDYVVVNRLAYRAGEIERGDVVVFPAPNSPEIDYIKRVVALPGDRIAIYNGAVVVNGVTLQEPYILERQGGNYAERIVPAGYIFVMGDNRNNSDDSRSWGFLAIENIIGKAVFRYWPFTNMNVVDHPVLLAGQP